MGAILGTALSLTLTISGAAVAAGGAPAAGSHLAGHVLLGIGIGLLAASVIRFAARLVMARAHAREDEPPVQQSRADATVVALLPAHRAHAAPLRGRHAA